LQARYRHDCLQGKKYKSTMLAKVKVNLRSEEMDMNKHIDTDVRSS